jgi:hypothetical protein
MKQHWQQGSAEAPESKAGHSSSRFKSSGETGASAVELAFILPVLVAILAGIMDFGVVFNNLMALRQGIGAGVRQGVVAQSGTTSTCAMPGADSADTKTKQLICLVKSRIGLDENNTRTKISFPGVKTRGGSLVICAQYPLSSASTILAPILTGQLKSEVQMRIEQDLSSFGSSTETPLPGGNWTWCV